jgi:hypothetical protein
MDIDNTTISINNSKLEGNRRERGGPVLQQMVGLVEDGSKDGRRSMVDKNRRV